MSLHTLEPCKTCHIWHCPVCGCTPSRTTDQTTDRSPIA